MIKKFLNSKSVSLILFCVISLLAGGVNGFVGTGGGILLVFALSSILGMDKKEAFATSHSITVPISAIAIFNYIKAGNIDFGIIKEMWLPVLLGGIIGALLEAKIKLSLLNGIFGILIIYSGTCMIFG